MATVREASAEWRDRNDSSKYPFADAATLTNGRDFLGEAVFLDAALYPIGAHTTLFLSAVEVDGNSITLFVGSPLDRELLSVVFDITDPPDTLALKDRYDRPAGVLVSEAVRLASFQSWRQGRSEFTAAQTEFVARVCFPLPEPGVRGFLLDDGTVVTGEVWLIGEDGVTLSPHVVEVPAAGNPEETEQHTVIRVDIVGDPLFRRRLCGDVFSGPVFLQSLTFRRGCSYITCHPDQYGNISITAGSGLAARPVLRIRNTASSLVFETIGQTVQNR